MQSIFDAITEWLKELLVEGIMGNLGGLFTNVNEQVGEIAAQVGTTPAAWNAGVLPPFTKLTHSAPETLQIPGGNFLRGSDTRFFCCAGLSPPDTGPAPGPARSGRHR